MKQPLEDVNSQTCPVSQQAALCNISKFKCVLCYFPAMWPWISYGRLTAGKNSPQISGAGHTSCLL